ncbi:flagellar basal body-associated FliL family protein [Roseobacter sp. YSTF-M11]|uniref:Flagellar protein FliL n=1 Tax=Roseobacter insulae TaxID=2859783 RepID=A0A9X1FTV2_9RHOB|nr:flagellar basal body-associated FliL family protein [Roseobacter insulae]MBW4706990.1 flagellar basal body-associated FliL family protein [Roseobacter insulae]
MADAATVEPSTDKKSSKMPLIIGLVLLLAGGGGGFYATWSGLILNNESAAEPVEEETPEALPKVAFVSIEPITISLPSRSVQKHLRFRAELEVTKKYVDDVELIMPRVVDVLNSYLRALELSDIENPSSLTRLRAQMLRRVQAVAGPDRVNDLLIMEFVLN